MVGKTLYYCDKPLTIMGDSIYSYPFSCAATQKLWHQTSIVRLQLIFRNFIVLHLLDMFFLYYINYITYTMIIKPLTIT